MKRGSGILLHISSLPSKYGIGTFGKEARRWIRFLKRAHQSYWQILPLNPTSFGDSPYQSFSAFAMNPYFIDLEILMKKGYLRQEELEALESKSGRKVDYGFLYATRFDILRTASQRAYAVEKERINRFYRKEKYWLKDYAVFMTIKTMQNGAPFSSWPEDLKLHKRVVIEEIIKKEEKEFSFWIFVQYEAFSQYKALKKYANKYGVSIIGDMPIYVSEDSADVFGNPKEFLLDGRRNPKKVAGVPPDYFSEDGQLWGNPLYNWKYMEKKDYRFWKRRMKMANRLYDFVRIDHFRAFASYYTIPKNAINAKNGKWEKGPGYPFFERMKSVAPDVQIIAEDLGVASKDVSELLKKTQFPGLKVYEFAFSDYEECLKNPLKERKEYLKRHENEWTKKQKKEFLLTNPYLPHNYEENCVAYIGTHDNAPLKSYLEEHKEEWKSMMDYLQIKKEEDIFDTLLGSLIRSRADVVIFTMQDLLKFSEKYRMNFPGKREGNWCFRCLRSDMTKALAEHLKRMSYEAGR